MSSMHYIIYLFVIFFSFSCVQTNQSIDEFTALRQTADEINKRLEDRVNSDGVHENMDAILEWSKKLEKKCISKLTFNRASTCNLYQAVQQFTSLTQMLAPDRCFSDNLERLTNIQEALNHSATEQKCRLDKIYDYYAGKYQKMCHYKRIGRLISNLEPKYLETLDRLEQIDDLPGYATHVDRQYAHVIIRRTGPGMSNIRDDFENYLVKPCAVMKLQIGEMFKIGLDSIISDFDLGEEISKPVLKHRKAVVHCKFILENTEALWNSVKRLL